jgi:hypothetical protein
VRDRKLQKFAKTLVGATVDPAHDLARGAGSHIFGKEN